MGIGKEYFLMGQAAAKVLLVCEGSLAENHGAALVFFHHSRRTKLLLGLG